MKANTEAQDLPSGTSGFTLVEMVGVLAVIAVLSSFLVPKIFSAINEGRLNSAVASLNSCKSAATVFFGKYGRFGTLGGKAETNALVINWDTEVLMPEGLLEKPFGPRLAETAYIQIIDGVSKDTDPAYDNPAYNLDNKPLVNKNDAYGYKVIEAVFKNITKEDAWEMSYRIDGDLGTLEDKAGNEDLTGKVKYRILGSIGDCRIYLSHK